MSYQSITVRPCTANIGAEIDGIDLCRSRFGNQHPRIARRLDEHHAVLPRSAGDVDQHKALGRTRRPPASTRVRRRPTAIPGTQWFTPMKNPSMCPVNAGTPMLLRGRGHRWQNPASLSGAEVGGDTLFASMYAAYDSLSERMKTYLDGLTAMHSGEQVYRGRYVDRGGDDSHKVYPTAVHPVAWHRLRDWPQRRLAVNCNFTTYILDLPRDESRDIRFPHTIARNRLPKPASAAATASLSDNRCVQHLAIWDYHLQSACH